MDSVKDLAVLKEPQNNKKGKGQFIFSDRYSVFDWGEMPDHIIEKGKAICIATAYFFEKLEKEGVKTHYLGIIEDRKTKRLDELKEPQNIMEFHLLRVIRPKIYGDSYDYSAYQEEEGNFLIPFEIIYRNSLPQGSSVFKRLKEGSLKLEDIGLKEMPLCGEVLTEPILEVSTKLEAKDRFISWEEARRMGNLTEDEIEEIKKITLIINKIISEEVRGISLFNEDGKVEFGFDEERNLIVVDAIGTLDECRFTYQGIPISKEIARIYYRKTTWYKDIESAKKQNILNWKALVKSSPPPLPKKLTNLISLIYQAYTNELTKRKWFDSPPLQQLLNNMKDLI
jgi:phosphoribosylaminoimidazole-succinocarboxamide synthase